VRLGPPEGFAHQRRSLAILSHWCRFGSPRLKPARPRIGAAPSAERPTKRHCDARSSRTGEGISACLGASVWVSPGLATSSPDEPHPKSLERRHLNRRPADAPTRTSPH
jgi:hypothetical protein